MIMKEEIIFDSVDISQIKKDIVSPYINILNSLEEVYIFGAARLGQKCAHICRNKGIIVKGFIDNNVNLQGTLIDGINVYSIDYYLKDKDIPIIVATLNYWSEFEDQLSKLGIENYMHYIILHFWDPVFSIPHEAFEGVVEDVINNKYKYQNIKDSFADERSRIILDELIKFRLTMDICHARKAYDLSIEKGAQYFEQEIVNFVDKEIFVDGGAYKGETSLEFINQLHKRGMYYEKIYLIEPDEKLIKIAMNNLSKDKNITFYPFGLSNIDEILRFNSTGDAGGAFYLTLTGDIEIPVKALDDIISQSPTFIKLDIEGFEAQALLGAQNTIRRNRPKLAICAYHRAGDIWRLFSLINEMRDDYKVYIRHYTPSYFETVLYFV